MNSVFAIILGAAFPLLMTVAILIGLRQSTMKDSLKNKYAKRLIFIISMWTISIWTMSYYGIFEYHPGDIAPRFLVGLMLPLLLGLALSRNSKFLNVLDHIPLYLIVGVQTFRVLGISFLFMAQQGIGPRAFASAGYGDLVTGVLACIGGIMLLIGYSKAKWVVWAFNLAGMFDLVNVSRILLTYYPSWYIQEPSTGIAGTFPTVLIICLAAPIALMLHIYSIRALLRTKVIMPRPEKA